MRTSPVPACSGRSEAVDVDLDPIATDPAMPTAPPPSAARRGRASSFSEPMTASIVAPLELTVRALAERPCS